MGFTYPALHRTKAAWQRRRTLCEGHFISLSLVPLAFAVAQAATLGVGLAYTPYYGLAINDHGTVAGYRAVPSSFRRNQIAVIYAKGRVIDIDRRPATENRFSRGEGINNYGWVVGSSNHLSGFIYRGKRMESLNALVDPKGGWNIQFPRAINDKRQIAATAVRGGVQYAMRLDPIRPHVLAAPDLTDGDEAGPILE